MFVSGLWQIHAFSEGNTRTTAVFSIQYLRSLGFVVENDLFGEQWDLRNRYLHIHPTKEWSRQLNLAAPASTPQVPRKYPASSPQAQDKHGTSTGQAQDKLHTDNPNIIRLIKVVGEQELSVKDIMEGIGLKDRNNLSHLYLYPAVAEGYVCLLYPDKPRHPRQRYLLTVKGLALYQEVTKE